MIDETLLNATKPGSAVAPGAAWPGPTVEPADDDSISDPVTYVVLLEKDPVWGFPRRLGIYEIARPQETAGRYRAPVIPLKEIALHIPYQAFGPRAATERSARDLAIRDLRLIAGQMNLELLVRTDKRRE